MDLYPTKKLLSFLTVSLSLETLASPSISEIHYNNIGVDTDESIEITTTADFDLRAWSLVLYNGKNGNSYNTIELSEFAVSPRACDDGKSTVVVKYPTNGIQNGSPDAVALVKPSGEPTEFISYGGQVRAKSGPAKGRISHDIGVTESPDTPLGFSLQKYHDRWDNPKPNNFGRCQRDKNPGATTKIHEIQGRGESVSHGVFTIEAVVVGDYQDSNQLSGFFVQEEDKDADEDIRTSEGIFIYCSSCETQVSVGDKVRVKGVASEHFGMSQISSTFKDDIQVLTSGVELPRPAIIRLPVKTRSDNLAAASAEVNHYYESMEGMLVQFAKPLSVSEHLTLGRFGQILLSADGRMRQFTDRNTPSAHGYIQHKIALLSRRIILDDDNNRQNAALFDNRPVLFPEPGFSVKNFFRGGDTIDKLSGVLHWSWSGKPGTEAWRVRPVKEIYSYDFVSNNVRKTHVRNSGGRLKVASFNILNYFTTLDNGLALCGPNGNLACRGANSPAELARQTRKIVSAICAMDADILGLMEIENPSRNASKTAIKFLLNAINEKCPTYVSLIKGAIGIDAISVGLIYKPDTVALVGEAAILDDSEFTDPLRRGKNKNRPALAGTFEEIHSGNTLTVVVNHLKSKGSPCGIDDDDTLTGQGNCNRTRTLAAEYQATWLQTIPTGFESKNTLVIGDLNAYRKEDPIRTFIRRGYTDLVNFFSGKNAYSYVFDGQIGYLDHALANQNLLQYVTGLSHWHINADEVNFLDYNDTLVDPGERIFDAKPSALPLFDSGPYRSSDHDPLVLGIQFPTRLRFDKLGERKQHYHPKKRTELPFR